MKRVLFLASFLFAINSFAQNKVMDARFRGLDTAFSRVLKEWKAPGFAVAVVEKNKVIFAEGFGYEDYEKKIPTTINTQYAIGSCTKAFTTSLLGLLRKENQVDFDQPVKKYLPELTFYNEELTNNITLKDMMVHRTGLPRYDYSWYLWQSNSADSLMERIKYFKPAAGLRKVYQYNNWMYFLQGMVISKITGKTWEENIRDKFFVPLEMTNSNLTLSERQKYPNAAKGYELKNDSLIKNMDFYDLAGMGAAGSINSTVMDMAKWVTIWINGGKYNGKEILPAAFINEAKSSQMVMGGSLPEKDNPGLYFSNYGYGWSLSSYKGHYRVEHGGNIDGFSASTCFFPSDSIGIVVLVNQDASSVPSVVRNILADRLLKVDRQDWQTKLKASQVKAKKSAEETAKNTVSNRKQGTFPTHSMKDYTGNYHNPAFGNIKVFLRNDSLFSRIGKLTNWSRHYHYDVFENFIIDKDEKIDTTGQGLKFMFAMNEAGDIISLSGSLEVSQEPIVFIRKPNIERVGKDSLSAYAGNYELGGLKMSVVVKADNILTLSVPGQPIYELQPTKKDEFAIKDAPGFSIKFLRNERNEIVELISQQPNGNFKAKKL